MKAGEELTPEFFRQNPVDCARALIGMEFRWDGCSGRIVETEAYWDHQDAASHLFTRASTREFAAKNPPGAAYVYLCYGMHWLFNMLVKYPDGDGLILFRALEPRSGLEKMKERRGKVAERRLCAGPGCLAQAFGIGPEQHGAAFLGSPQRGITVGKRGKVQAGPRIGISKAVEKPWRFCLAHSPYLSAKGG